MKLSLTLVNIRKLTLRYGVVFEAIPNRGGRLLARFGKC